MGFLIFFLALEIFLGTVILIAVPYFRVTALNMVAFIIGAYATSLVFGLGFLDPLGLLLIPVGASGVVALKIWAFKHLPPDFPLDSRWM